MKTPVLMTTAALRKAVNSLKLIVTIIMLVLMMIVTLKADAHTHQKSAMITTPVPLKNVVLSEVVYSQILTAVI